MVFKSHDPYYLHVIDVAGVTGAYGATVAKTFLDAIADTDLTGEVEILAGEPMWGTDRYFFAIGIAIKGVANDDIDDKYYAKKALGTGLEQRGLKTLPLGEYCYRGDLAAMLAVRGRVRFQSGKPVAITEDVDSFFIAAVREAMDSDDLAPQA